MSHKFIFALTSDSIFDICKTWALSFSGIIGFIGAIATLTQTLNVGRITSVMLVSALISFLLTWINAIRMSPKPVPANTFDQHADGASCSETDSQSSNQGKPNGPLSSRVLLKDLVQRPKLKSTDKWDAAYLSGALWMIAILALISFGMYYLAGRIIYLDQRLQSTHLNANGRVVNKSASSGSDNNLPGALQIEYEYPVSIGSQGARSYKDTASVSQNLFESLKIGDEVIVLYSPDMPDWSRMQGATDTTASESLIALAIAIALSVWMISRVRSLSYAYLLKANAQSAVGVIRTGGKDSSNSTFAP
jgi:hypothetical protein